MSWRPYSNIVHLTSALLPHHRVRNVRDRVRYARQWASEIRRQTHRGITEEGAPLDERPYEWPVMIDISAYPPLVLEALEESGYTRRLYQFLIRGNRTSRRKLEQLLLAYAVAGFPPLEAYEQAALDYASISDVMELDVDEVFTFATFFFDVASPDDLGEVRSYFSTRYPNENEIRILRGTLELDYVRAYLGVTRNLNVKALIERCLHLGLSAVHRISKMLMLRNPTSYFEPFGSEPLKGLSMYIKSVLQYVQVYLTGEFDASDDARDLFEHFVVRQRELMVERRQVEHQTPVPDHPDSHGLTLDDLRAMNRKRLEVLREHEEKAAEEAEGEYESLPLLHPAIQDEPSGIEDSDE